VGDELSYLQACTIGLLQGVTELFPISSLGHSVLVPALIGGSWRNVLAQQHQSESPYLAFLVGLHVATALVLLFHFRTTWARVVTGGLTSLRDRRIETPDQRLCWLLIAVTIPVGVIGLAFEHTLRTAFAKPTSAALFLTINGVLLLTGERLRRRSADKVLETEPSVPSSTTVDARSRDLSTLELREGAAIGFGQALALLPGISRSGVTMVAGLLRGLDHEDAARFSFLAATPIILAAGVYKLPDLFGPLGDGIRGQILAGSVCSAVAAYGAVRFLEKLFRTQTLTPFAIYSLIVGGGCLIRFGLFG